MMKIDIYKNVRFILSCAVGALLLNIACMTGGGSDVGNPDVYGSVLYRNGEPASGVRVVIGRCGSNVGLIDSTYYKESGGISFIITTETVFDTTETDSKGEFSFKSIGPGDYTIVASRNGLSSVITFTMGSFEFNVTPLRLNMSSTLQIKTVHSLPWDTTNFITARIDGTVLHSSVDSNGILYFDSVPPGKIDLLLYGKSFDAISYTNIITTEGCNGIIIADPLRPVSDWVYKGCGYREYFSHPYILWSSPEAGSEGAFARVNYNKFYSLSIQFSLPMDTRLSTKSFSLKTSDENCVIDSIWWKGSDVAEIKLKRTDSFKEVLYKAGYSYSVILDTSARSAFGVNVSFPETLTITPEPVVRLSSLKIGDTTIYLDRSSVSSQEYTFNVANQLFPVDGVNSFELRFNALVYGTNSDGKISMTRNDTASIVRTENHGNSIVVYTDSLFSSNRYNIVIDKSIVFQNDIRLPFSQQISFIAIP